MTKYLILLLLPVLVIGAEADYTDKWCAEQGGQREVVVKGGRIDCLTDKYAVEFGYANKWKEDITQALWYAKQTGKIPAIGMISSHSDSVYEDYAEEYLTFYGAYLKIIIIPK